MAVRNMVNTRDLAEGGNERLLTIGIFGSIKNQMKTMDCGRVGGGVR